MGAGHSNSNHKRRQPGGQRGRHGSPQLQPPHVRGPVAPPASTSAPEAEAPREANGPARPLPAHRHIAPRTGAPPIAQYPPAPAHRLGQNGHATPRAPEAEAVARRGPPPPAAKLPRTEGAPDGEARRTPPFAVTSSPAEQQRVPTAEDAAEQEGSGEVPQSYPASIPRAPVRAAARGDVGPLIETLREVFLRDRAAAAQGNTVRCGICYLHFARGELEYREPEGFYVCARCAEELGGHTLPMVRPQQR